MVPVPVCYAAGYGLTQVPFQSVLTASESRSRPGHVKVDGPAGRLEDHGPARRCGRLKRGSPAMVAPADLCAPAA